MDPEELALWIAYAEADGPFWGMRADVHAAQISQLIAATGGCREDLDKFMVKWGGADDRLIPFADGIRMLEARQRAATKTKIGQR